MAALSVKNPTLLDLAKATGPDGKAAKIAEILNETNEILDDMVWLPGNLTDGHKGSIRLGLPDPSFVKIYGRIQPTKARTAQVVDKTGRIEDVGEVDARLAKLADDLPGFLLQENRAHIEGISQKLAQYIVYGNEGTEPEAFTGFMPRFNLLSADNGENIIDAGGTGTDNNSILLVAWGEGKVHGIVPKNSVAGIQVENLGTETSETTDGLMRVIRTWYSVDAGLHVKDWRCVVRVANIDKSLLTKDAATGPDLPDLMYQALEQLPAGIMGSSKMAFYMSRRTRSFVRRQLVNKTKDSTLTIENVGGKMIMSFQGVPMKRVDAMSADEARVV